MKRIPLMYALLFVIVISVSTASAIALAQDGETAVNEQSGTVSIVQTVPVSASVEVNINGQIYTVAIPVMVNIDTQQDLSQALLTTQAVHIAGDVQWIITAITEYQEEYELNDYRVLAPSSPNNKLVIIESELTNLDSAPFSYNQKTSDQFAYDELGNLYQPLDRACEDINPGSTGTCSLVYDVPLTTTIQGIDIEVIDHKRISFATE